MLLFTVLFALCGSTRGSNTQVSLFLSPISVVEFYPQKKTQQLWKSSAESTCRFKHFFVFRLQPRILRFIVRRKRQKTETRHKAKRNQRDMNTIARFEKSQGLKKCISNVFFFLSSLFLFVFLSSSLCGLHFRIFLSFFFFSSVSLPPFQPKCAPTAEKRRQKKSALHKVLQ